MLLLDIVIPQIRLYMIVRVSQGTLLLSKLDCLVFLERKKVQLYVATTLLQSLKSEVYLIISYMTCNPLYL